MSDFSSSEWPHWNTLTSTYRESYSLSNQEVYEAAGEIWPKALKFAQSRNVDESEAREELLKAVGRVSGKGPENIKALPSYLFTSYAHRIQRLLAKQKHYASLESVNVDLAADPTAAKVMQNHLLVAEIVARMNEEMRTIHEGLILGYTFEELAKKLGKSSNYLRTKFNRGVKRLAREVRDAELPRDE